MNQQTVIDLGSEAVMMSMKIAAPALVAILIMGIIISVLQAATQINEQTLSFIPKIIAMTFALVATGPWILQTMMFFTKEIFKKLATVTQ